MCCQYSFSCAVIHADRTKWCSNKDLEIKSWIFWKKKKKSEDSCREILGGELGYMNQPSKHWTLAYSQEQIKSCNHYFIPPLSQMAIWELIRVLLQRIIEYVFPEDQESKTRLSFKVMLLLANFLFARFHIHYSLIKVVKWFPFRLPIYFIMFRYVKKVPAVISTENLP